MLAFLLVDAYILVGFEIGLLDIDAVFWYVDLDEVVGFRKVEFE